MSEEIIKVLDELGKRFGIIKNVCMPEMVIYEYITNIQ